MKTNLICVGKIEGISIYQRSDDGYFNATRLFKEYNNSLDFNESHHIGKSDMKKESESLNIGKSDIKKKELFHYFENPSTQEFIKSIYKKEFMKTELKALPNADGVYELDDDYSKIIKSKTVVKASRANRGDNAGTWVHPLLFIDMMMYLNPDFKYEALKWVQQEMMKYRIDAGDNTKELSKRVAKLASKECLFKEDMQEVYKGINRAINMIIYGKHEDNIRNSDLSKTKELNDYIEKLVMLIDEGYIDTYDKLKDRLRKDYARYMELS